MIELFWWMIPKIKNFQLYPFNWLMTLLFKKPGHFYYLYIVTNFASFFIFSNFLNFNMKDAFWIQPLYMFTFAYTT